MESGVEVSELAEWSAGVEAQQATADEEIKYLSETLVQIDYKNKSASEEMRRGAGRERSRQTTSV